MKTLKVNRTEQENGNVLIHYPKRELKKANIDSQDIWIVADENNNWHHAGFNNDASVVLPEKCSHNGHEHNFFGLHCVLHAIKQ